MYWFLAMTMQVAQLPTIPVQKMTMYTTVMGTSELYGRCCGPSWLNREPSSPTNPLTFSSITFFCSNFPLFFLLFCGYIVHFSPQNHRKSSEKSQTGNRKFNRNSIFLRNNQRHWSQFANQLNWFRLIFNVRAVRSTPRCPAVARASDAGWLNPRHRTPRKPNFFLFCLKHTTRTDSHTSALWRIALHNAQAIVSQPCVLCLSRWPLRLRSRRSVFIFNRGNLGKTNTHWKCSDINLELANLLFGWKVYYRWA